MNDDMPAEGPPGPVQIRHIDPDELPLFLPGEEAVRDAYTVMCDIWTHIAILTLTEEARGIHVQPAGRPHHAWGEPDRIARRAGESWGLWATDGQAWVAEVVALATAEGSVLVSISTEAGAAALVVDPDEPPAGWWLRNPVIGSL